MRRPPRVVAFGILLQAFALIAATGAGCATGGGFAPEQAEGSTDDGDDNDDGMQAHDGTTPVERGTSDGGDATTEGGTVEDVGSSEGDDTPDASGDAMTTGDGFATDGSPDASESGAPDASERGASDAAIAEGASDATFDASGCYLGPSPAYQLSCTNCSINDTCLLSCQSCTTRAQTQNDNPSLQLPCEAGSVQNVDGVLACN